MTSKRNTRPECRAARETPAFYGGPGGEIVLYRAPDGTVSLDVRLERETVWLDAEADV